MAGRLTEKRESFGLKRSTLRIIGMSFAALGLLSRGLLQTRVLGVGVSAGEELLKTLELSGGMAAATTALVLEGLETCAVPVFAALLLEGFANTTSFRNYFLRVAGLAVVCELPYNFAVSGKLIEGSSRNPVFGLALALVMLYFFRYSEKTGTKSILLKLAVFAATFLWTVLFRVKFGVMMIVIVAILWLLRRRHTLSYLAATAGTVCCCIGNPLYMFAPFGFLVVHFYNGEQGRENQVLQYAIYPLLLILTGAVGKLLF